VKAIAAPDTKDPCVYMAGNFSLAGDAIASGLAYYNHQTGQWKSIGDTNFDWPVNALALDTSTSSQTIIYAGGQFDSVSGIPFTAGIARWDATNGWQPLMTGISGTVNSLVFDSTTSSLIAGGEFLQRFSRA
jgi:hypothetical protein